MRVLALSGSLRAASVNSGLLRAAARLAPPDLELIVFPRLGELPLFDPDREAVLATVPIPAVGALYDAVAGADALLIASPEYAHGVSGTIKNALDWLVGFEPFVYKPVAVWNASPRSHHADDSLREILRTMSARVIEAGSIGFDLPNSCRDEERMIASAVVSSAIRAALAELRSAISP